MKPQDLKTEDLVLKPEYLKDGDLILKERLKDPEFKKAYEEEALKFKIALAIYRERKARHLSQAKLAAKAKTTQRMISKIEHCEGSVGVDLLQRIANALSLKFNISIESY